MLFKPGTPTDCFRKLGLTVQSDHCEGCGEAILGTISLQQAEQSQKNGCNGECFSPIAPPFFKVEQFQKKLPGFSIGGVPLLGGSLALKGVPFMRLSNLDFYMTCCKGVALYFVPGWCVSFSIGKHKPESHEGN